MRICEIVHQNKVVAAYLFFGICTTFVNICIYWGCTYFFKFSIMQGTVIAWAGAVLFSYFTNRKFVFHSEREEKRAVLIQMLLFFVMRLGTGVIDWLFMLVFVDLLCFHDMICKMIANIIVIAINFIGSKFVIFKRQ